MAPTKSAVPLISGATSVSSTASFNTPSIAKSLLLTLLDSGITHIDTAQLYGNSEVLLGAAGVAELGFTVDSKVPGTFAPGSLEPSRLISDARRSVARLGVQSLDVFYIHSPDRSGAYPIAQTLAICDALHREGLFRRLGLSNFFVDEVRSAVETAEANGWLVPSVFQGNYSAVARRAEDELIPYLRSKQFAFYAYSPLAGGFLAKRNRDDLFGKETGGRFAKDGQLSHAMYQGMYSSKPKLVDALETWSRIADEEGCESPAELGYRWIAWNSVLDPDLGDKVIVGASKLGQIPQVVGWVKKGALSDRAVEGIERIWEEVKDQAPFDNLNQG